MNEYVIPGDPIPLQRARHGGGKTWDPQKQLKLNWSLALVNQHGDRPFYEGPLHVDIIFYMPKPKTSQKQRDILEDKPHFYKPDVDNLIKWVFDCSNKILFKDDSSIASVNSKKKYSNNPRTLIRIIEYADMIRDESLLPDIYEGF